MKLNLENRQMGQETAPQLNPIGKLLGASISCLLALCALGCGSTLVLNHSDPTLASGLEVQLDGNGVGSLSYGESLSVSVEPGSHLVDLIATTTISLAETEAMSWFVYVDESVEITLLPPARASTMAE